MATFKERIYLPMMILIRTMKKFLSGEVLLFLLFFPLIVFSQYGGNMSVEEYIKKYSIIAINEMNLHRIPASITIAQGLLETNNGNSELARYANNHFGIKCKNDWTGQTYYKDDEQENECFRKYNSPYESFVDHSVFLSTHDRYRFLFDLNLQDYRGWARGLKTAGYATNPEYANKLIKLIEEHSLYALDEQFVPGKILITNEKEIYSDTSFLLHFLAIDSVQSVSFHSTYRRIFENNGVKFILARREDSYYKIAHDFAIYTYQIPKYNELPKRGFPQEGQIIYLEKKKRKSAFNYHLVAYGQTLHFIAQKYAIRSKSLLKLNRMQKDDPLIAGQILRLNPSVPLP